MDKNKQSLTTEIKELALKNAIDLMGVAAIERWNEGPKETRPTTYMPDATNVIVLAKHILAGTCDVWGEWTEEGKSAGPYLFSGYGLLNLELARVADLIAKHIEYRGYKSLVFPPTWGVSLYRFADHNVKILDREKVLMADFSHRHAAVAAGLGELGWHGLLITPQFGTRQRVISIINNASLVTDPMYEGPKLCNKRECKERFNNPCITKCPTGAIKEKKGQKCKIGDKVFFYSKTDKVRCHWAIFGLVEGDGGRTQLRIPPGPGKVEDWWEAIQKSTSADSFLLQSRGVILGDFCGACLRECPAGVKVPE